MMPMVWLTGLPATGKSTVAGHLREILALRSVCAVIFDGDEVRRILTPNPTYSDDERDRFYADLADLAALASGQGLTTLVPATAPRRAYRDRARSLVDTFVEVYLVADPALLEWRDPKGLYTLARAGRIDRLPGQGAIYEAPESPDLVFDTGVRTPDGIALEIADFLREAAETHAARGAS